MGCVSGPEVRTIPGRPDIALTRARIAVFVDGCFWHRCPDHGTAPKNNGECIAVSAIAHYAIDMTVLLPLIKGAKGA